MSGRYRLIESPNGNGKIFRDDEFVTEISYRLTLELQDGRLLDFGFRDNRENIAALSDFYSTKQ